MAKSMEDIINEHFINDPLSSRVDAKMIADRLREEGYVHKDDREEESHE